MKYDKCPVCFQYDFLDKHKCPPMLYFKHDHWGEEFMPIRAWTFAGAAEQVAEQYFDGEPIDNDSQIEVVITDKKKTKKFRVKATIEVCYDAEEVEDESI